MISDAQGPFGDESGQVLVPNDDASLSSNGLYAFPNSSLWRSRDLEFWWKDDDALGDVSIPLGPTPIFCRNTNTSREPNENKWVFRFDFFDP
jgi:hypothetical protein